ncbi:MBL fold metallo-hydrolase, partial [Candidatus Parcubacteria bacterium]|nr:MBL fold metallo-hydrolase [Candidatus Parcubacteria bacterium]
MSKSILTCWGGAGAVTGANFLLESGDKKFLIDCGLVQGAGGESQGEFGYDPKTIDYLFVTHAHIDHIGRIPELVSKGFAGNIYSTPETKEIARVMLQDLLHIANQNEKDLEAAMRLWQTLEYHKPENFGAITVELYDAGHILGSAMYKFAALSGKSLLFT